MTNDLLFVYGTLLSTDNEFACYLKSCSTFCGEGNIKGRLYDMGDYPGVITGTNHDYDIKGSIYQLHSSETLKVIDDYEGYGDDQDQPNLYIRKILPVAMVDGLVDGLVDCWVYVYNLSVDGLLEIESGNYIAYLKIK